MEEIIISLQNWEAVRNNPNILNSLFMNKLGFELNMSLFPATVPLHAYAAVKNGELGFYVISEAYDVNSPQAVLGSNCYWCPCLNTLGGEQQISKKEAALRIDSWKKSSRQWINTIVNMPFGMYQTFHIPTTDLQSEVYAALFGLKNNMITPSVKAADLVLMNEAGVYYDTVRSEPPYADSSKYYILDLI